jgi:hypothetical protein
MEDSVRPNPEVSMSRKRRSIELVAMERAWPRVKAGAAPELVTAMESVLSLPRDQQDWLAYELLDKATFKWLDLLERLYGHREIWRTTNRRGEEDVQDGWTPDDDALLLWFFEDHPAEACAVISEHKGHTAESYHTKLDMAVAIAAATRIAAQP